MKQNKKVVYLDNAATTKISKKALKTLIKANKQYYNPSAIYDKGFETKAAIRNCTEQIANILNCNPDNIYYTSGGTESDNWAIKGLLSYGLENGKTTIITSSIEHHAILRALESIEQMYPGKFNIVYIDPNSEGVISPFDVENAIKENEGKVLLCSIMTTNNVVGTRQLIWDIGDICRENDVIFHTDAVQAVGHVLLDLSELPIDLMSASAHKFHGPKGIGFLYVGNNAKDKIAPLINGGGQQGGLRAGTENYPLIASMTEALKECRVMAGDKTKVKIKDKEKFLKKRVKINNLRNYLSSELRKFANVKYNGSVAFYNLGTFNVSLKDINSDVLVNVLGSKGFLISVGSACDTGELEDSYVLKAMKQPKEYMGGMIRITFNEYNTMREMKKFIKALRKEVLAERGYI